MVNYMSFAHQRSTNPGSLLGAGSCIYGFERDMTASPMRNFSRHVAILAFACLTLFAQSERGAINGSVTDPAGAAIPGASITLTNLATNTVATAVSSGSGEYALPNLLPGDYRLEVT